VPEVYRPRFADTDRSGFTSQISKPIRVEHLPKVRHACPRARLKRGHFVYWMVPDEPKYTPDEIENHPHVGVIPYHSYSGSIRR